MFRILGSVDPGQLSDIETIEAERPPPSNRTSTDGHFQDRLNLESGTWTSIPVAATWKTRLHRYAISVRARLWPASGSGRFTILLTLFLAFGALTPSARIDLWAIVLFVLTGASGWLSFVIIRREVRRQVGTWELPRTGADSEVFPGPRLCDSGAGP